MFSLLKLSRRGKEIWELFPRRLTGKHGGRDPAVSIDSYETSNCVSTSLRDFLSTKLLFIGMLCLTFPNTTVWCWLNWRSINDSLYTKLRFCEGSLPTVLIVTVLWYEFRHIFCHSHRQLCSRCDTLTYIFWYPFLIMCKKVILKIYLEN